MKKILLRIVGVALCCAPVGCFVYLLTATKALITQTVALLLLLVSIVLIAVYAISIVRQKRKAIETLREERDNFERLLKDMPLPVLAVTAERKIKFLNNEALRFYQCENDVIDQPCDCIRTSVCDKIKCVINQKESGKEYTYYDLDGKTYMVSSHILFGNKEQDNIYVEMAQDITDIMKEQRAMKEKIIELETVYGNLLTGILVTAISDDFPVIRCNKGYLDLMECTEAQIINNPAMYGLAPTDKKILTDEIQKQLEVGEYVFIEQNMHLINGNELWVRLRGKRATLRDREVCVWILTNIDSIKETEAEIRINEERYRIAMQNTEDIIIDYDMKTHKMYHSSKAEAIYGVPELMDNMPQSILDFGTVLPESAADYLNLFYQLSQGVEKCSCILRAKAADGRILWNRLSFTAILDNYGNAVRAIGILQDITREKEAEAKYIRESRFRELIGKDGVTYYEADITHGRFISGHESIVQAYCEEPTNDFNTVMDLLLVHMVYEPDRKMVREQTSLETLNDYYKSGKENNRFEYRRYIGDELIWMESSMQFFVEEESKSVHYVACLKNINEAKLKEISLTKKAERDLLTGLYNKVTTESLIKKLIDSSADNQIGGTFLLIDIDNFKRVNDTLGHAFGDAVLTEVSRGLHSLFRPEDIVGRVGGDEFVVYLNTVVDEQIAVKKAQQICDMFRNMYSGANNNYKISGTIGISIFPAHGNSFKDLYENADCALYFAKGKGKDTFSIYTTDLKKTI